MNKFIANIEDAVIYQNEVWFFAMDFNGLFSKSIGGAIQSYGNVPWEPLDGKRLYTSIQLFDRKIYLIPCHAKNIAIYDIEKKEFYQIDLKYRNESGSFMASAIYQHYLFMFGFYSPCVARLNLNNNQISYFCEWYDEAKKYVWDEKAPFFRSQLLQRDNSFMIPFFNANALLRFDAESLKSEIYVLGTEKKGYSGICEWNKKIACLSYMSNDAILVIDCDKNKFLTQIWDVDLTGYNSHFSGMLNSGEKLKLFTLFLSEYKNLQIANEILLKQGDYSFVRDEENISYYYDRLSGELCIFDKINQKETVEKLEINVVYSSIFRLNINYVLQEDCCDDLKDFLKYISYSNIKYSSENAIQNGKETYEF